MSNILIVDDDPEIRTLVSHYLQKAGYYVMTAESANEALEKELEVIPDCVLLDKMMPGMDGFEFLERLKSATAASSIRVIILSSCDRSDDIVEGLDTGADDYIVKPFVPSVLLARIRAQMRTKALLDHHHRENESLKKKLTDLSS